MRALQIVEARKIAMLDNVEIKILLGILKKVKPKTVLEIGSSFGGTLFLFSRIASPDGTIITIDLPEGPFGGSPMWTTELFNSFAVEKQKIHSIREDSHKETTLEKVKSLVRQHVDFGLPVMNPGLARFPVVSESNSPLPAYPSHRSSLVGQRNSSITRAR